MCVPNVANRFSKRRSWRWWSEPTLSTVVESGTVLESGKRFREASPFGVLDRETSVCSGFVFLLSADLVRTISRVEFGLYGSLSVNFDWFIES